MMSWFCPSHTPQLEITNCDFKFSNSPSLIPTPNSSIARCIQSVFDYLPPPRLLSTDTSQNTFGLQLVRIVAHTGFTQVQPFRQRLASNGWVLLDDVDHRFFGGEQFLMDSLLASFMASGWLFLDSAFLRLFQNEWV